MVLDIFTRLPCCALIVVEVEVADDMSESSVSNLSRTLEEIDSEWFVIRLFLSVTSNIGHENTPLLLKKGGAGTSSSNRRWGDDERFPNR